MQAFIKTFDFIDWILDTYFSIKIMGWSFVFKDEITGSFKGSSLFISLDWFKLNLSFAFDFREKQFFPLVFTFKQLILFSKLLKG